MFLLRRWKEERRRRWRCSTCGCGKPWKPCRRSADIGGLERENKRPSWEGGGGERVSSIGWNLVEGVVVVVWGR
ncbi:hypothetical protein RHGRI_033348 [Rhododendron griersonianum]|uniref:Uncharacterized protein n=1 Tax=Rhododendron griersonianum TaxID=479676 RepID=A0AAV6HWH7_9ERIC|nr:hypothetical protein RHGRI_033348 [Rhododendron griersonianum]